MSWLDRIRNKKPASESDSPQPLETKKKGEAVPVKGIKAGKVTQASPDTVKTDKKANALGTNIIPKKEESEKISLGKRFKNFRKEVRSSLPFFGSSKKPSKDEVKAEIPMLARTDAVKDLRGDPEKREALLRDVKMTFETLLTAMENEENLPEGLFRIQGNEALNKPFQEALLNGHKTKMENLIVQSQGDGIDLHQLANFAKRCAQVVADNPQLFAEEKDKAALRESLEPLQKIFLKIAEQQEHTLMPWSNIEILIKGDDKAQLLMKQMPEMKPVFLKLFEISNSTNETEPKALDNLEAKMKTLEENLKKPK